ncbi:MAG: hypothetical protein MOB07_19855 [Acidobacteria bacterium]|nr:hypothetical protein [Acidobacteriota bacterium]
MNALTVEELSLMKELIERECFDIEIQGEDIVLLAVQKDPELDEWIEEKGFSQKLHGGGNVVNVAKIKFLPMVSDSMSNLIDDVKAKCEDEDKGEDEFRQEARAHLLALAGLLREATRFVEKRPNR